MFYVKNIPAWERWLRVGAGALLIGSGLLLLHGTRFGYHFMIAGTVAMLTGFVGFCPLCALAGRRLKKEP